jgi:FkbM family methyltransferase
MNTSLLLLRLHKILKALQNPITLGALLKNRTLAASEHNKVLKLPLSTIVDVGANKGQFSLAMRSQSNARIYAFEPLSKAAETCRRNFADDNNFVLFEAAIGDSLGSQVIHVSASSDSSSLLSIGAAQIDNFPGTHEVAQEMVKVGPLSHFIAHDELEKCCLLKLDVQGFELQALKGCSDYFDKIQYVYCECSFVELYEGQALISEVVSYLNQHSFGLTGVYNLQTAKDGSCLQADFLFSKPGK